MFRSPKPGLPKFPDPRTSSLGFLYLPRNSIRENFNSTDDQHPQIFPKTISPEIFSGTFPKNLSGTRDDRPVRDFPKMPHRTFCQIPASNPHLMQPTLNPSPYQPAPFSTSTQPAPCRDS